MVSILKIKIQKSEVKNFTVNQRYIRNRTIKQEVKNAEL